MSANKSFSTETSERYSRALFEVAKEFGELEKVEEDIKNFELLVNNSSEIKNFIHNLTQSVENQNSLINLLSEKLSFSKNLKNFLKTVFILFSLTIGSFKKNIVLILYTIILV